MTSRHVLLVEPHRHWLTRHVTMRPVPVHAGGIVWYVTHGDSGHRAAVTAWVAPDSGGVVALGRF